MHSSVQSPAMTTVSTPSAFNFSSRYDFPSGRKTQNMSNIFEW